ncbi:MAG TPA: hypothetical protein DDW45_02580 [Gammaproteobacteria bacterium]|nr:hypothetical protein [Gammaproteobacteria bacterium]
MQTEEIKSQPVMDDVAMLRQRIVESMEGRLKTGLLPYAGEWLSLSTIQKRVSAARKKARIKLFELFLLYLLMTLLSAMLVLLVILLCY